MQIDGSEVLDATSKMTLNISKTDVDQAVRRKGQKDCWSCAAQRRAEQTPGVLGAAINLSICYILRKKGRSAVWYRYRTSVPLRTEIISFDRSGIFTPGEYDLLPILKSQIAYRSKKRPGPSGPPSIRRKAAGARPHAMCGLRTNGHNTFHPEKNKK